MKIVIGKPKKVFLFILSILTVIIISSILAYLTDKEQKQNEFTIGSIDIKLEESAWDALPDIDNSGVPDAAEAMGPGEIIVKDPKVVNQGKNDAIVYLKVEVPKAEIKVGEGNLERQELFTFAVNSDNWIIMSDLTVDDENKITYIYYYKNGTEDYLRAGATTETLFDSVTLKDITNFNGLELEQQIVVKAYAIQLAEEFTVESNPWISKFEEEKKLPEMQGVRVLSSPVNVSIGWQQRETIKLGIVYLEEITVTEAPTLTAQIADGAEVELQYDGIETAALEKNLNLAVSSRANEGVKTILKYKYVIKDGEVGEFKIKTLTGGKLYTSKGKKIPINMVPTIQEEEKVIIKEPVLYSKISPQNYGQEVNYTVTSNGIEINKWQIFCKERDEVTIIAKDVIEYNAIPINDTGSGGTNPGAGVKKGTGNTSNPCQYRVYWTKQSSDSTGREYAVNKLLGAYKSGNADIWKDFVRSDLKGKALAMGGVTATTFVNSWNSYPGQEQKIAIAGSESTGIGVKIGSSASASDTIKAADVSTTNKSIDLYFPQKDAFQDGTVYTSGSNAYNTTGKCNGYWIASPSGTMAKCVMYVGYTGNISGAGYYGATDGIRPVVRLKAGIKGNYQNGKWTIN